MKTPKGFFIMVILHYGNGEIEASFSLGKFLYIYFFNFILEFKHFGSVVF